MAIVTDTYETFDSVSIPEQVLDKIYRIAREETPIYSSAKKKKIKSKSPEWQTQALASAGTNQLAEGGVFAMNARTATARVKNHCQISYKGVSITRSNQAVDHYGYSNELGYQKMLASIELKRDIEFAIVQNNASVAGSTGTAGECGGVESWLTSNVSRGTGGSNGGYSNGTTSAATDGTQRVFTEDLLLGVLQTGYDNGAKFTVGHFGSFNKRRFSTFQGNASRVSEKEKKISNTITVYESDFGTLTVSINPQQRTRTGLLYDMDKIAVLNLRPMEEAKLAKTNDSDEQVIVTEFTTQIVQLGLGVIADLTTS
jgi:Family of unknown function (DUF5309)